MLGCLYLRLGVLSRLREGRELQVLRVTTTGLVIDSGNGVSHRMTIHEGYARYAILHSAGRDLTEGLTRSSPSKGTLPLPPQRRRLLVVSKRSFATCRLTTTQCSNRPRKVPTRFIPGAGRFCRTSVLPASFHWHPVDSTTLLFRAT